MRCPRTLASATPAPARIALTALVCLGLLSFAGSSEAVDPKERKHEVDQGISDLEHQLEGTSAELQAAFAALQSSEARLPQAQSELAQAEGTRAQAQRTDVELAGRMAAAQESQTAAEGAIVEGSAAIESTEVAIGQIASQTYRRAGLAPELTIVLDARSPEDFADRYVMVDTALRSQNGALARLQEQQAVRANAEARLVAVEQEVTRLRAEAAANLDVARRAEAAATERKAEIDQLVVQQQQSAAVIEARRGEEIARLDQLEAERTALETELARLAEVARQEAAERAAREAAERAVAEREAAEREAATRASRSRAAVPSAPAAEPAAEPSADAALLRPVGSRITSQYGYRIHPIYKTRRLHAGTDFAGPCGVPIKAAEDGTIVRAGVNGGFGNQVVVDHGIVNGQPVATSYNHMSGYERTSGSVTRGDVIGYIGTTGASTGCHLHFEVYVDGATTNPMGWLEGAERGL